MSSSSSFYSKRRFYGDEHFSFGIRRSGEFTIEQVELLENHGYAYQALHLGERPAITDEENSFIEVCQGLRIAESPHERAWLRYCEKTQTPKAVFSVGEHTTAEEYYDTDED